MNYPIFVAFTNPCHPDRMLHVNAQHVECVAVEGGRTTVHLVSGTAVCVAESVDKALGVILSAIGDAMQTAFDDARLLAGDGGE